MAAAVGRLMRRSAWSRVSSTFLPTTGSRLFSSKANAVPSKKNLTARLLAVAVGSTVGAALAGALYIGNKRRECNEQRPPVTPTRQVKGQNDVSLLQLTLYQYQTCPFCCKARAYLDYYGYNYNVVEVNSISRAQARWSKYGKVPILCIENVDGSDEYLQVNDSSVIVSLLQSHRVSSYHDSLSLLATYYPSIETKDSRGRTVLDYPNKYFVMFGDNAPATEFPNLREEREWRQWADKELVHTLSPNIYRTPSEALQAFHHFSDVGGWKQAFSSVECLVIVYCGSAVMYVIGKLLKKRHHLKDNVRLSLYESCNKWVAALGTHRLFMGGELPNLADLAVYGILSSIEGCEAFEDVLAHTAVGPWYERVKSAVRDQRGSTVSPRPVTNTS